MRCGNFRRRPIAARLRCPYRVAGTPNDIDVNVAPMDAAALRQQWPFGGLIDVPADYLASIPVPVSREAGLAGKATIIYADVATPPTVEEMVTVLGARWQTFRAAFRMPVVKTVPRRASFGIAEYVAWKRTDVSFARLCSRPPSRRPPTRSAPLRRNSFASAKV